MNDKGGVQQNACCKLSLVFAVDLFVRTNIQEDDLLCIVRNVVDDLLCIVRNVVDDLLCIVRNVVDDLLCIVRNVVDDPVLSSQLVGIEMPETASFWLSKFCRILRS
ncbi:MAG: hypothetical protein ACREBI_05080 [Nitrosotalea sp.]